MINSDKWNKVILLIKKRKIREAKHTFYFKNLFFSSSFLLLRLPFPSPMSSCSLYNLKKGGNWILLSGLHLLASSNPYTHKSRKKFNQNPTFEAIERHGQQIKITFFGQRRLLYDPKPHQKASFFVSSAQLKQARQAKSSKQGGRKMATDSGRERERGEMVGSKDNWNNL